MSQGHSEILVFMSIRRPYEPRVQLPDEWSAVRVFHYKVLRTLVLGLVKWGNVPSRVLNGLSSYPQTFFLPWAQTARIRCTRTTQHVQLPHNSLHVIKSAMTRPGTTSGPGMMTAAAKIVPICMSASFANVLTTRPRSAPNASSTSPLTTRTHHPSLADYLHCRPLPHQPLIHL